MLFPFASDFRQALEPNPVFKRELRARWRRPAAYLTLFFYAAPLALGMALFYGTTLDATLLGDQNLADVGKTLFDSLLALQIVLWLFIAAITAAPTIAGERERGLLEGLQLANLSARRIVAGKCLSLFSFNLLLFLVPLPILAICFMLGGVEPRAFLSGAVDIAVSALCGTAIGLYFSSIRPRPGPALRDTLIFLVAWTALALLSAEHQVHLSWPLIVRRLMALLELVHPVGGLRWMQGAVFQWPARAALPDEVNGFFPIVRWPAGVPGTTPLFDSVDSQTSWAVCMVGLLVLTLLFFVLALRGTARVFVEGELLERRPWRFKPRRTPATAGGNSSQSSSRVSPRNSPRRQRALYWDVPLLSGRSFDNPIFGRELRGKTRWRVATPLAWLGRALLFLLPTGFAFYWLLSLQGASPYVMERAPRDLALFYLGLLSLYASATGATAFTRERESNTWENLRLSLLLPGQILQGKVWPLLIALAVLSPPLMLALSFFSSLQPVPRDYTYSYNYDYNAVPTFSVWHAAAVTLVVLATAFVSGCVALFISWLSRSTQVALGLSLAVNAFWLLVFYIIADTSYRDTDFQYYLSWWNAPAAIGVLTRNAKFGYGASYGDTSVVLQTLAFFCTFFMAGVATFFVLVVSGFLRQKFRDEK